MASFLRVLVLLAATHTLRCVGAQGLIGTPPDALGASATVYAQLARHRKLAAAFRASYKANPPAACQRGRGSLCAVDAGSQDQMEALLLATSPSSYDARRGTGVNPIGPPGDQVGGRPFAIRFCRSPEWDLLRERLLHGLNCCSDSPSTQLCATGQLPFELNMLHFASFLHALPLTLSEWMLGVSPAYVRKGRY